jgi:hypothetical protein
MSPREVISKWLDGVWEESGANWDFHAENLLKALDEQGMAVVPKDISRQPLDRDAADALYKLKGGMC